MSSINSSGVTIGPDGNIRFSGLSSGIDSQAIINAQIQASRAPAVQKENQISTNTQKIADYQTLNTLAQTFTSNLDRLRSSTSFFTTDIFESKVGFATSASAADAPAGYTPATAGSILGTTVSDSAETGTFKIRVNSLATAHVISSDALTSKTADLTTLGVSAGAFTINGESVTIATGDTLIDLRDAINASTNNGVDASIVTVSDSEHYLVLSAEAEGLTNAITLGSGTTSSDDLGLTDAGAIKTVLTPAGDANLTVNGITGVTRSSNEISDVIDGVTLSLFDAEGDTELTLSIEADLNSIKTELVAFVDNYNALRDFYDTQRVEQDRDLAVDADGDGDATNDAEFGSLAFDQTLRSLMSSINNILLSADDTLADGFQGLSQIGITVDEDFRLQINDATLDARLLANVQEVAKIFEFTGSSSNSKVQVASRNNTTQAGTYFINFAGTNSSGEMTGANMVAAETVTQALLYSEQFQQSSAWTATGVTLTADAITAPDGTTSADLLTKDGTANRTVTQNVTGLIDGDPYYFSVFLRDNNAGEAQLNLDLGADNFIVDVDLTAGSISTNGSSATLYDSGIQDVGNGWYRVWVAGTADATGSGSVSVLPDPDGANGEGVYAWGANFTQSAAPGVYARTTTATTTTDAPTSNAGFGGASNGTVAIGAGGITLTGNAGNNFSGLQIIYNPGANADPLNYVRVEVKRGLADLLYDALNAASKASGTLEDQITSLSSQNEDLQEQIATIESRLATERSRLEAQYLAMEQALAQLDSLRNTIQSFTDAQNADN